MKYQSLISTAKHGTPSIASPHARTLERKIAQPPVGNALSINHLTVNPANPQAGERYEREADRAASAIMTGPSGFPQFSTAALNAPVVQRQPAPQPNPPAGDGQAAAKKALEAFFATEDGKKIKEQASDAGESFLSTLDGKIVSGAAVITALSVLAGTNSALPAQLPDIPLDSLGLPGVSAKITYEGPVRNPTAASLSFTYKGSDKSKKKKPTASEKYKAETEKMKTRLGKIQEEPTGSEKNKEERSQVVKSKKENLFGQPETPGLKPKSETLKMRDRDEDEATVQKKAAPGTQTTGMAPAAVNEVLAQGGQPLDPATRAYMEPRFGQDFSHVRVHADARAAASAQSLNALAYTVKNHIVFGTGQFSPQSSEGRKLLAHEMTHVIQQTGASGVQTRSSTPGDIHERAADRAAAVLFQGRSVQVPATGSPPYLQRQEKLQLTPPSLIAPTQQSNIHLLNPNLKLGPHLLPEDKTNIDGYLALHGFSASEQFAPMFDGAVTSIDAVTDKVTPLVLPIIPRDEVKAYVMQRYIILTTQALAGIKIVVPPVEIPNIFAPVPDAKQEAPEKNRVNFTTATNLALHVNLTSKPGSSGDATMQVQFGEEGDLSRVFQVSYNLNNQQVQVLVGGQGTKDIVAINKILKLSGFVQILAGVAWTGSPASGTMTVIQPSAGTQLTATIHDIQFSVQAAVSITGTQGQPTTGEINVTPQVTFPLESKPKTEKRTPSSELTDYFEVRDWVERSSYSQLERLQTSEKVRLISIILHADVIINFDADAVANMWQASTAGERQQLRPVIESAIPKAHLPAVEAKFRGLLKAE